MSTSTSTTTPMASAPNIARYTQALSSNLGNLMSELARASAPSNDGILRQLQIITDQLTLVNRRLDTLENNSSQPTDNVVALELSERHTLSLPTPAENNARARIHNATARYSSDALLPMHNENNTRIMGSPPTLGHFAQLDATVENHLRKVFKLSNDLHALEIFYGVKDEHRRRAALYFILQEDTILLRIHRREARDAEIAATGPATPATKRAAAIHNRAARAHNSQADCGDYDMVPIHDDRNLAVRGFPTEFEEVVKPKHLADVLYFLGEYGQSREVKGCVHRWEMFVGVIVIDMGDCHYHTQREWLW